MIKVLVVDDSVVFRSQITGALSGNPVIEIVGSAPNGTLALKKLAQLSVDVVTLDMEMPDMNGIEVLREIKKQGFPVRVIIFSSQTQRGAEAALLALSAGADDVVAKPSGEGLTPETATQKIRELLLPKVLQFRSKTPDSHSSPVNDTPIQSWTPSTLPPSTSSKRDLGQFLPAAVVIGSSTGGPAALERIFKNLRGPLQVPIFIVQHMPPVFTEILAKRLSDVSGIPASEGKSGMVAVPNHIYIAPGDFHMTLDKVEQGVRISLNQAPQRNSVRPAVDYLFESAARIYKAGCLGIVLTGMGEDGLVGARAIRENNGPIVIQDKDSCVVFGMPGAIFGANEYDQIGNLEYITAMLNRLTKVKAS